MHSFVVINQPHPHGFPCLDLFLTYQTVLPPDAEAKKKKLEPEKSGQKITNNNVEQHSGLLDENDKP